MLKKLIISTFLATLIGGSVGCVVRTGPAGGGHRCGRGTNWNGNRCAPNVVKRNNNNTVIIRDHRN